MAKEYKSMACSTGAENIIEATLKRREAAKTRIANKAREFTLRKQIIEEYFYRTSSVHKLYLLKSFMSNINSVVTLTSLLSTMYTVADKLAYYLRVMPDTDVLLDKQICDHNRAMDDDALVRTIFEDSIWFSYLTDSQQYLMALDLLRIAGPATCRVFFPTLVKIYYKVKRDNAQKKDEKEDPPPVEEEVPEPFDPKHPSTLKVEALRKNWDEILSKYQKQVDADAEKLFGKQKKEDTIKQDKKSEKAAKTGKTKSDTSQNDIITQIQMLPIWLVKKIFGYLDDKSLSKLNEVNSYWDYVVDDLIKDRKARKQIDKQKEAFLAQIDPDFLKAKLEEEKKMKLEKPVKKKVNKRVEKLSKRAAVLEKLRTHVSFYEKYSTSALLTSSGACRTDEFTLPFHMLTSFPRKKNRDNLRLLKPCPKLFEIPDITQEDVMEQRDQLFYILSQTSLMTIISFNKTAEPQNW